MSRHKYVWPVMLTPFTDDDKIDFQAIPKMVDWYIQNGCDGMFAVCQSSEMFNLSKQEKVDLAKAVLDAVDGRVPVVVSGHTAMDQKTQFEEIEEMAKLPVDGYILVSAALDPDNKGSDVLLKNYYATAERFPELTLGVYECPQPYKRLLTTEELKELAQNGRLEYMKDTCCDQDILRERLAAVKGTNLKLMNANAETFFDSFDHGCAGYNGPMCNFHPQYYRWMLDRFETDREAAKRMSDFLTMLVMVNKVPYPMIAKYHMNLVGVPMSLHSRSKDVGLFGKMQKLQIDSMYALECYVNEQLGL